MHGICKSSNSHAAINVLVRDSDTRMLVGGVVVKLLDADGTQVFDAQDTDETGKAGFIVPFGAVYELRCFKFGLRFDNPIYVKVPCASETRESDVFTYEVICHMPRFPEAMDHRFCCASGYFRNADGTPHVGLRMEFRTEFSSFVLDGAGVTTGAIAVTTNAHGYASVQLIKHAKYRVTIADWIPIDRTITVPDRWSVELLPLLYPRISCIACERELPITIEVGHQTLVPIRVFTTDGREETDMNTVIWSVEPKDTARIIEKKLGRLIIQGLKRGNAEIQVIRKESKQSPVYYPNTPIYGAPLAVRVV